MTSHTINKNGSTHTVVKFETFDDLEAFWIENILDSGIKSKVIGKTLILINATLPI
jgi:hypothetical protein